MNKFILNKGVIYNASNALVIDIERHSRIYSDYCIVMGVETNEALCFCNKERRDAAMRKIIEFLKDDSASFLEL